MEKCPEGYGCPRYCHGRCGYCGHAFSTTDGISVCLKHSKQINHLDNHCEDFICIKLGRFKVDLRLTKNNQISEVNKMEYQTYIQDCNCKSFGIIFIQNVPVCRWCRKPLVKGGKIQYSEENVSVYWYTKEESV